MAPPIQAPRPTPRWQTVATVLLILHLFCLGLGVAINADGGKSLVGQALRGIPLARRYLQLLMMDLAYDFQLAEPTPEDGVHRLQLASGNMLPATPATTSVPGSTAISAELPTDGTQPRIRRQRYQQLAYHLATFDQAFRDNPDLRTELPLAIAERWLRDLGAPHASYVLQCTTAPSPRLPKVLETAPAPLKEGGPRKAQEDSAAPAITIYLVWDEEEQHYQGAREQPRGEASEVAPSDPPAPPAEAGSPGK